MFRITDLNSGLNSVYTKSEINTKVNTINTSIDTKATKAIVPGGTGIIDANSLLTRDGHYISFDWSARGIFIDGTKVASF